MGMPFGTLGIERAKSLGEGGSLCWRHEGTLWKDIPFELKLSTSSRHSHFLPSFSRLGPGVFLLL